MEKTVESFNKTLELAAKYSWAVFVLVSAMLIAPDGIAKQIGIDEIRTTFKGYLWLTLGFSGLLFIASIRGQLWRFAICPLKKLLFPVKDLKKGIKQSRMRYQLVKFANTLGEEILVYQEADSNGGNTRYYDIRGNRFFDDGWQSCGHVDHRNYHFPRWGRIDWRDVLSGDAKSGCWAIEHR